MGKPEEEFSVLVMSAKINEGKRKTNRERPP
jgi:hypothetical protein